MRFAVYVLIVLLYVGNFFLGVSLLFYGLSLPTPYVFLSSILNWVGAWVLCYFGYRRSKVFGYVLVTVTVVLTMLVIGSVALVAWYMAASSE